MRRLRRRVRHLGHPACYEGRVKAGRRLWTVFKLALWAFRADRASRFAAAIAYYTIFSIVPIILIAIAAVGLVFGRDAAQAEIFGKLTDSLGAATAKAIQDMIKGAAETKAGTIATIAAR